MRYPFLFLLILLFSQKTSALTSWQQIQHPIGNEAQAIGEFANGCVIGAKPLSLNHSGYQVMRSLQRRYFGHPNLLHFIGRLATQVKKKKLGVILIGDMSMPAGGRFTHGHVSHQTGLDVDIWLQLPKSRWSKDQLSNPQEINLVAVNNKEVISRLWKPEITQLIRLAAKDKDVTRIFVHPAIKKQLCNTIYVDRNWLNKIRPWFGHRAHMHVRLRCPLNSSECIEQPPPTAGDGCGKELLSWFNEPTENDDPKDIRLPLVAPESCRALLTSYTKK